MSFYFLVNQYNFRYYAELFIISFTYSLTAKIQTASYEGMYPPHCQIWILRILAEMPLMLKGSMGKLTSLNRLKSINFPRILGSMLFIHREQANG